jgi:arsenate reductase (thioredoxin)
MTQSGLRTGICIAIIVAALANGAAQGGDEKIVFVCEHGAAKSVIATAYFNKLAAERGLPDRATYRGANPQAELSVSALRGLREDGLALPSAKPSPIASGDVTKATHIFAIGCGLPAHAASSGKAESWDDVPDDQGYAAQRDAIKRHVERLLDSLQKR